MQVPYPSYPEPASLLAGLRGDPRTHARQHAGSTPPNVPA